MYLCKNLTNASLPEIGRSFGGKHHSTVIHSVRKIESCASVTEIQQPSRHPLGVVALEQETALQGSVFHSSVGEGLRMVCAAG